MIKYSEIEYHKNTNKGILPMSETHTHIFDDGNPLAERNTRLAVALTAFMMVAEIIGGWIYNSMALLADEYMGTHALASDWQLRRTVRHDAMQAMGGLRSGHGKLKSWAATPLRCFCWLLRH